MKPENMGETTTATSMLETECVGDDFEMLIINIVDDRFITLKKSYYVYVTNIFILKLSPS